MRKPTLDLEALRSFVMGIELGSFAKAADHLSRSTSAVSAHLKKLEEQIGQALVHRDGRHLKLTSAGLRLMKSAKQLLAVNDDAFLQLKKGQINGRVRLGLQEDFGEQVLTETLARFSRAFPDVEIAVKVTRNAQLQEGIVAGSIDLALVWALDTPQVSSILGRFPMQWIAPKDYVIAPDKALPLVLFEQPCLMREHALQALDQHACDWRIALTSHSLSGAWAAVEAGLGITVRTLAGMPSSLSIIESEHLPTLPVLKLLMLNAEGEKSDAVQALQDTLKEALHQHFSAYGC
ncbi:LysR substrate-binding domain-containing protein [Marinomonas transparens]|uniref:LysR family transcriptional regulator n=1 Tax=Marinomonas transparens TaxID=2795388 RepID=A0A934MUV1_9GAMM|nr:LysR substrate-binding domain-containing protein [Marinomonas transparens]MBJ7536349.1 LysR family transcriptional regulator [Marinomonas transparens]